MTRAIDRKRRVDTAFEVCPELYRAITWPKARRKTYRQFPPGFLDPIVIDECHQGSAIDDSAWREIPEYFSPATRIGLTAKPKETKYVSNIACFGEPVYSCFPEAGHPRRLARAPQAGQEPSLRSTRTWVPMVFRK